MHSSLSNARRWASSIVADDLDSIDYDEEGEDDDNYQSIIEDNETNLIEEEIAPRSNFQKKKKLTKRQKRKQSLSGDQPLDVKFLHFRNLDDNENYSTAIKELEQKFDQLAFDHDLSKFKWISMLEKSLVLKLRQEQEQDENENENKITIRNDSTNTDEESPKSKKRRKKIASNKNPQNDRVRDYWKVALKAANNKSKVPDDLKDHFLNRMVVGAAQSTTASKEDSATGVLLDDTETERIRNDAQLLARGRELSVDHPLLWRRYSAKERKLKVRLSKKLVEQKANEIIAARTRTTDQRDDDHLSLEEQTIRSAVEDKSTSLEFYLNNVRIPTLQKLHHEDKTSDQRQQEAMNFQQLLRERLPETSYSKMIALVQTYVDCFGENNSEPDNPDGSRLVNLRESPLTPVSADIREKQKQLKKKQKQKQKQFRVLLSNLRKTLPQGRIHWIGKDVADFFYVTTPDKVDLKNQDTIASDPILGHSEANWKETRSQYAESFLNIQKLFLELEREQGEQRKLRESATKSSSSSTTSSAEMDGFLDPNEDPSSEKSVLKTFETVAALSRMDAKKFTTQRVKPRKYIPLEAMAVGDTWKNSSASEWNHLIESQAHQLKQHPAEFSSSATADNHSSSSSGSAITGAPSTVFDSDSFPLHPPGDRLVIVDNLPIDMTELRLRQAYDRCGDIENIAIFHSRPDLDPGRKATDSAKKIRNPSSSSRRQKWTRPRTPLYAMILYKDAASAKKASCEPLRLFGMVLDQHLMRSHRASDMRTLYLEDVPCSIQTMEFKLGQLLEASDLYVCLDDSAQDLNLRTKAGRYGKKHLFNQQLLSYTIRFPSFEAAYWSYWKLSRELPLLETKSHPSHLYSPALHWMDTPGDSYLYWTRKLNF